MASLKALKGRIASVKSTQKITKAMKMVAAAKLRRAQQAAEAGRPYAERLEAVMASLAGQVTVGPESPKLLAGTGSDQTHLLVVCTSDRGLAGAFNSNIVRAARKKADELIARGQDRLFLPGRPQGPRGDRPSVPEADRPPVRHQRRSSRSRFADAQAIADELIERYETGGFDVVHLFYARFQSALVQEPVGQQIIPVPPSRRREAAAAGGAPPRSNMSPTRRRSSPRCCPATSPSRSSAPCSRTPRPSRAAG